MWGLLKFDENQEVVELLREDSHLSEKAASVVDELKRRDPEFKLKPAEDGASRLVRLLITSVRLNDGNKWLT